MKKITRRTITTTLTGAAAGATMMPWLQAKAAEGPLKVGFVYVGPVGDHGWTYQHEQGRLGLVKALGNRIRTRYIENVNEGPDAERAIKNMAVGGQDLIFATSFGYMNPMLKVAKMFPKKYFEHSTGYQRAENMSTYNARFYEGRYICGLIAGKVSKKAKVGYVASFPIPEVVRGINSFTLGLRKTNPEATVHVVWVNTWLNPGKEADATRALIDQGVDIICQHTDSTAPLQEAQKRGVHGFGQASDMWVFAPKAQLTAIVNNWSPYYVSRAEAVLNGTWASKDTWGGLTKKMIKMAPYANMPDSVVKLAKATEADIRLGKLHPFTGPFSKQDGTQVVGAGKVLGDGDLLGMDYYVQGVKSEFPTG